MFFSPVTQAAEKNDTVTLKKQYKFNAKDLILPGTLIAVGATSLFFAPMENLENSIQKNMTKLRGNNHRIALDEYLRYAPTAINITLSFAGKGSKYSLKDRLLIRATSIATMYALTQGIKHTVNRTRPDASDNHSFPSGHTAGAFLGAENLRINHGNWWGLAGYTAATATAFLRLYNNRHWFGDVITGAGIGILSAHVGYWLLPFEKKIFGFDQKENKGEKSSSMIIVPTYDTANNAYGMALALQF